MFNGFKQANKHYWNDRHKQTLPRLNPLVWLGFMWYSLNVQILFLYRDKTYSQKIYRFQKPIFKYTPRILMSPFWLVFLPFRLVFRLFERIMYRISQPFPDTCTLDIEDVQRRYPNASVMECETCEWILGFYLDQGSHKGWRYFDTYNHWTKHKLISKAIHKLKQYLSKFGICWESAYYLTPSGEPVNETCNLDESMEYISSDSEYTFSLDGDIEGDVCGGCVEGIWNCGTRFKIYKGKERGELRYYNGMAQVSNCDSQGLYNDYSDQVEEITLNPDNKEQNVYDLETMVDRGKDRVKKFFINIADHLDIPLFADGCSNISLYGLLEHKKIWDQVKDDLEYKKEFNPEDYSQYKE